MPTKTMNSKPQPKAKLNYLQKTDTLKLIQHFYAVTKGEILDTFNKTPHLVHKQEQLNIAYAKGLFELVMGYNTPLSQQTEELANVMYLDTAMEHNLINIDWIGYMRILKQQGATDKSTVIEQALALHEQKMTQYAQTGSHNNNDWFEAIGSDMEPKDILHHFDLCIYPNLHDKFYSLRASSKRTLHELFARKKQELTHKVQEAKLFRAEVVKSIFDLVVGNDHHNLSKLNLFVDVMYLKATTCKHMDGREAFEDCVEILKEDNNPKHVLIAQALKLCKNTFDGKEPMKFM